MSDIANVKTFLDTMNYDQKQKALLDLEKGQFPFLTISRETGAGGHRLAEAVLREIENEKHGPLFGGWQVFDKELCEKIAADPALRVSFQSLLSKEYSSDIEDMVQELVGGWSPQYSVLKKMFEMIRTLALFGKAIIVGRAAVCLTQKLPLGIHVRLLASLSSRTNRMMELFNFTEKQAKDEIKKQDKARAKLVKTYFNRDIEDPLLYDAVLNSDSASMETLARMIVLMIKDRVRSRGLSFPAP